MSEQAASIPLTSEQYAGELAALRRQSARLQRLVDVMPAGVVILDGDGRVVQANRVAVSLLDEPLEGQRWVDVIARAFKPQADDGHEVSLGDGRRVKIDITPLEDEPGQLILLTDLTETRALQQKISHMQRLSALGRMMASLAHQIRTPLSAALLYAVNLGNSTLSQSSRQQFQHKLISRLRDLEKQVNDMLLFARNGQSGPVEPLSLQALLGQVHSSCEALLQQQGARLETHLPEPDICIMGNSSSLAGAIVNLLHNSVQIVGKGCHIRLSARRSQQDPAQVEILVADNGPGIEPGKEQAIFEPFFTTRQQGTGLGLAVVKSVVSSHQGQISVRNRAGGGAEFCIRLPVYRQEKMARQA